MLRRPIRALTSCRDFERISEDPLEASYGNEGYPMTTREQIVRRFLETLVKAAGQQAGPGIAELFAARARLGSTPTCVSA
jgi:hypothetical protein